MKEHPTTCKKRWLQQMYEMELAIKCEMIGTLVVEKRQSSHGINQATSKNKAKGSQESSFVCVCVYELAWSHFIID